MNHILDQVMKWLLTHEVVTHSLARKVIYHRINGLSKAYSVGRFLNAWLNVCVSGEKGKLRV